MCVGGFCYPDQQEVHINLALRIGKDFEDADKMAHRNYSNSVAERVNAASSNK